jgi:hypothetical protein
MTSSIVSLMLSQSFCGGDLLTRERMRPMTSPAQGTGARSRWLRPYRTAVVERPPGAPVGPGSTLCAHPYQFSIFDVDSCTGRFSVLLAALPSGSRPAVGGLLSLRHGLGGGKVGGVPAAAQGLDQQHGGAHSPAPELDRGHLVGQRDRLGGDHVEIADGARLVLVGGQRHGCLRIRHRLVLYLRLLLEDAEGG